MDPVMHQLARELTEAISAAVGEDARVEACRERARAAGFEMRVSLDAAVSFVPIAASAGQALVPVRGVDRQVSSSSSFEMTANDRRFLKSLRIAADETTGKEVE